MVLDCEAIIRSAMERKESRGAHTRSDFPEKDDERWLVNIITREDGGIMSRELVPVQKPPPELEELIKE
jgi:succinate dehydrogenase/fumarate reductase flavoprotein subunit